MVKGLGAEAALSARFRRRSDDVVRTALDVANVDAVFLPALEALPLIGMLVVLWYGGHQALDGDITIGTFAAFGFYLALLVNPLRTIGQRVGTAQRASAASARVVDVLRAEPVVVEASKPRSFPGDADVRFESVRFGYDRGRPVLDGFDLSIPAGTSLALVGATGSGKSTAAALLARFYDPGAGRVTIGGVDVRELELDDLRRGVGIVFEDAFLFGDTVRGNVGLAAPDAPDEDIERATQLAGAEEFVERLPEGYETMLGERGYSLSGGQRQRIAIARAILADPQVLILDDATSAVDATKEHEIRAALAQVMRGRTTLVIAHRPATIALADRVGARRGRARDRAGDTCRAPRALGALPLAARARGTGGGVIREQIGPILRPHRRLILVAAVAMIGATAVSLAAPLLTKVAIDRGIEQDDATVINAVALVYLVLVLARPVLERVIVLASARAGERFLGDLRVAAFDKLQQLSLPFFEQTRTGVLVSRLTNDVQTLTDVHAHGARGGGGLRPALRGDACHSRHALAGALARDARLGAAARVVVAALREALAPRLPRAPRPGRRDDVRRCRRASPACACCSRIGARRTATPRTACARGRRSPRGGGSRS